MNLSKIRAEKGVKVEELARVVGVSSAAIYKWESGRRSPSFKNMAKIAQFLGKTVDEIFFEKVLDKMSKNRLPSPNDK